MKKAKNLISIAVILGIVAVAAGCGGGGGVVSSTQTISGSVQTPGGTTTSRQAPRSAGALANVTTTTVAVALYVLDDSGNETQLGNAVNTDSSGNYSIPVSSGYSYASSRLMLATTVGSARLRSLVSETSGVNISPVSEATLQVVEETLGSLGKGFDDLTTTEIATIESSVETALANEDFSSAATISDAVSVAKNTISRDSDVSDSITTAANTNPLTTLAVFTTADSTYSSGAVSYITLTGDMSATPTATNNVLTTIHGDAVVETDGTYVYVINRYGGDSVTALNPANSFSVIWEESVGSGSNPQDIEVISTSKAYVSRYGTDSILIIDPTTGSQTGTISLADFADSDGVPEMAEMVKVGSYVFVTVQNLVNWAPAGTSRVVVVDTSTDAVVDVDSGTSGTQAISLVGQNPQYIAYDQNIGKIFVSCSGSYYSADVAGGIDVIDPTTYSVSQLVTKTALGGSPGDLAVVSSTKGYIVVSDANYVNSIVSFNPTTGAVGSSAVYTAGGYVANIAVDPFGYLVVGDRSDTNPGAVFIDTATDAVSKGPVSTDMPPAGVTFVSFASSG